MRCRICTSSNTLSHILYERMYATQEEFLYIECLDCGCVQIAKYLENLSSYYPHDYYAYNSSTDNTISIVKLYHRLNRMLLYNKSYKYNLAEPYLNYVRDNFEPSTSILDIGCGNGSLLKNLYLIGYDNLTGIDPYSTGFLELDTATFIRGNISQVQKTYKLIILNHVFEHMENQLNTLLSISNLLEDEGTILIRVPIIGEAWKMYQSYWVQLDAPRHLYIHSLKSIEIVCQQAGLRIDKLFYDSTEFQFWGSELYKIGLPLHKNSTAGSGIYNSIFSEIQIAEWKEKATVLNAQQKGDQLTIIIKR